jgi:hypothetical protein
METGDVPQPPIELQNGKDFCPVHGYRALKGGHNEADQNAPGALKPLPPLPDEAEEIEEAGRPF